MRNGISSITSVQKQPKRISLIKRVINKVFHRRYERMETEYYQALIWKNQNDEEFIKNILSERPDLKPWVDTHIGRKYKKKQSVNH